MYAASLKFKEENNGDINSIPSDENDPNYKEYEDLAKWIKYQRVSTSPSSFSLLFHTCDMCYVQELTLSLILFLYMICIQTSYRYGSG